MGESGLDLPEPDERVAGASTDAADELLDRLAIEQIDQLLADDSEAPPPAGLAEGSSIDMGAREPRKEPVDAARSPGEADVTVAVADVSLVAAGRVFSSAADTAITGPASSAAGVAIETTVGDEDRPALPAQVLPVLTSHALAGVLEPEVLRTASPPGVWSWRVRRWAKSTESLSDPSDRWIDLAGRVAVGTLILSLAALGYLWWLDVME